jgi:hypothetical protein
MSDFIGLLWFGFIAFVVYQSIEKQKRLQREREAKIELMKTHPEVFAKVVADEQQAGQKINLHPIVKSVVAPLLAVAVKRYLGKR